MYGSLPKYSFCSTENKQVAYQFPGSQGPYSLLFAFICHWRRDERRKNVLGASYLFLLMPRHTGYSHTKYVQEKRILGLSRLNYVLAVRAVFSLFSLGWCFVWDECCRVASTFCILQNEFIYFCQQLRAATWHSLIPLVISQAQ